MAREPREHIPLSQYTTLHVGGVADYVVEVTTLQELKAALLLAQERTKAPPLILGGGSNVLIPDEGYRGVVILMRIVGREYHDAGDSCVATYGAGEVLDELIEETCVKGLWGLENLSSIPGSIGATPVQNVGAYGVEVSSLITHVHAVHAKTLEEKIFTTDECDFLYRDSFFKTEAGKAWVITSVTLSLSTVPKPQLQYADLAALRDETIVSPRQVREVVQAIRAQKFPDWNQVGTAGSFFKNPLIRSEDFAALQQKYPAIIGHIQPDGRVKVSLGWILDKVCGLKGYCDGNVCLYEKQALVLIATHSATATEIKQFVATIQKKVFEKTNITIEPEVLFVK